MAQHLVGQRAGVRMRLTRAAAIRALAAAAAAGSIAAFSKDEVWVGSFVTLGSLMG
jgi:hypothetical protein